MYHGEGRFYYERMEEFIKAAKDLEVKEISKGVEIPKKEEFVTEEPVMDDEVKRLMKMINQSKHQNNILSDTLLYRTLYL